MDRNINKENHACSVRTSSKPSSCSLRRYLMDTRVMCCIWLRWAVLHATGQEDAIKLRPAAGANVLGVCMMGAVQKRRKQRANSHSW